MNWWTESTPDEIKPVPWMHPAAVLYLESLLKHDMTVIEHGCGGSTIFFAWRVKCVVSYEDDEAWGHKVNSLPLINADVYCREKPDDVYYKADILFIDGYGKDRPEWIRAAHKIVKPGGVVVVDNSERPAYQQAMGALSAYCVRPLHITGYTDYGKLVQTTFFRLKGGESWI